MLSREVLEVDYWATAKDIAIKFFKDQDYTYRLWNLTA